MAKNYSQEIAAAIKDFLTSDNWRYSFNEDEGIFTFNLALKGMIKNVQYYIHTGSDGYIVYAISPVGGIAKDRIMMKELADFTCRANYGLINGNFEIDMNDGEIRYKVFVDCSNGHIPNSAVIKESVCRPALMFDKYSEGFLDIIFNSLAAPFAIENCEKPRTETTTE